MAKTTKTADVSAEQVRRLEAMALAIGDCQMVETCRRAAAGSARARAQVARAIRMFDRAMAGPEGVIGFAR